MTKYVWGTDLHLSDVDFDKYHNFVSDIKKQNPKGLFLTGDISDQGNTVYWINRLVKDIDIPIYYVLGNHDYYGSSFSEVRRQLCDLEEDHVDLIYLTEGDIVPLSPKTALLGHDGWVDGRAGNYDQSEVKLRDYLNIEDLMGLDKEGQKETIQQLGDEASEILCERLERAFLRYDHVILLTHVPPFSEACLYENRPGNSLWFPHFVCDRLGKELRLIMERREEKSLLVLCGHSHNRVEFLAAPNLRVLVGGAEAEVADLKDSIYIHDGQAPHTEALNHIDDRLKQEEILNFWFGESCDVDYSQKSHQLWFGKNVEIDALLKERYFSLYELACEGKLSHWSVEPKGRMALILLLDQFSRNLFRESSQAFAQDSEALFLTLSGIDLGHDRLLSPIQRSFFYLPLEHSEDPKMQELSVQKMVELLSEVPWEYRNKYQSFVDYARRHKVIIDRFGRYPHRNKVLGRESTQDEIEFLKKEGSIF